MNNDKDIKKRSYNFALSIIQIVNKLSNDTTGIVIGKQLLRSGTSVGANIEEATAAYSKDDFIYKMNIALKESRETIYWLRLLKDAKTTDNLSLDNALEESNNIKNMLSAIVKTSRENKRYD